MRAWMKRHKILTGVLALLAIPVTLGGLNYSGMCLAEGRWLSDEEKIRRLARDITEDKYIYEKNENGNLKTYEQIPYKDVDEFLKGNPNCCRINPDTGPYDLPSPSFMDEITGYNSSVVVQFMYKKSYLDEKKDKKSINYSYVNTITNCSKQKEW